MKTLFAVLASASILVAPLAASAQDHHGGFGGRGDQGQPNAAAAPTRAAPAAPAAPANRGGATFRGGPPQGGFGGRGAPGVQGQAQRDFGGQDRGRGFAGGGQNFDRRNDNNRNDYNRGGYGRSDDRRGFSDRGDYRQNYAGRGYDRSFRWAVGAFLPRTYWSAYVDPYAYGLGQAPYGYHWVVVGDEALLIDDYTGAIVQESFL